MERTVAVSTLACAVFLGAPAVGEESRVVQILYRLVNANENRDHVMVVAHRGGRMVDGEIVIAENSIQAVDHAVEIGAEMVEIDVRMTKDREYVVLHDETLDRTTTCKGAIAEKTWDEVKYCQLVIEGTGEVTDETLPKLETILAAAKDRILINLDTKVLVSELVKMFALADGMGMRSQILASAAAHTDDELKTAVGVLEALGGDAALMPNIYDSRIKDLDAVENALIALKADVLQTRNQQEIGAPMTQDGGLMYSFRAMAMAQKYDVHYWINTLYAYSSPANAERSGGYRSGGRGDELAVLGQMPHEVYGFWAEQGATIIQTDEPEAAISWLEANGYRRPYP